MTPEQATKSLKYAHRRLERENAANHERYRKSVYRVQSACTHNWEEPPNRYDHCRQWICAGCGVVTEIKPTKGPK